MKRLISIFLTGRLQIILIASFSLVATLTIGVNALAISRLIRAYLSAAQAERVERDMKLASTFYQLKQDEVAAISYRLVYDPWLRDVLPDALQGQEPALQDIANLITNKITALALGGTHIIAILDAEGNMLVGQVLSADGEITTQYMKNHWGELPIVKKAISSGEKQAATEVIPADFLSFVGLEQQAKITLIDTAMAADRPYDKREGTAGLTLTGVYPFKDENGHVIGTAMTVYLFNNDFTLVDRIKEVAGVDTVTIFFGDLRVSTNVMTVDNLRAVGTRVSQEVFDMVLTEAKDYIGEAFVVNETYITRYQPLRDHMGNVVGMLYVGARKSSFQSLLDAFRKQVALIALVCVILAGVIAIPISNIISRPIAELVSANQRLAAGDMNVRVSPSGQGELAVLGHSFNNMVETLKQTQQELLHKEKLASMGQLAAGVAHELNNPLGTILLFADMLYKEAPENDPRGDDLKIIIDETNRCKVIVSDLLNFARQQNVQIEQIDLHELLERVIQSLLILPSFRGIEIKREYSHDIPGIQADPGQLQQVFINLLGNAAQAIENDGLITISTRLLQDDCVEIKVADTGCGIPSENLSKLFTPFFTTKGTGRGTGLGLSIVYGIIKMHRGQISVQSQLGKGTIFTIILPVHLSRWQFAVQTANNSSSFG